MNRLVFYGMAVLGMALGGVGSAGCRSAPLSAEAVRQLRENSLNLLKMSCSTHGNPDVRVAAAEALEQARPDEVMPWLQQGLYDPVPAVRMASCMVFSAVSPADLTAPFARLAGDEDPAVQAAALAALIERGQPDLRRRLSALICESPALRSPAAESLVRQAGALLPTSELRAGLITAAADDDAYRRALMAVLVSRSDPEVLGEVRGDLAACRTAGIELAAFAVDAAMVAPLLECLEADLDLPVRLAAARSLARFEFFDGLQLAVDALDHDTGRQSDVVRAMACHICGESGRIDVLKGVGSRLIDEPDPRVRAICAAAVLQLTAARGEELSP